MRLRHVKTVCQHHFVVEDAEGLLTEAVAAPVEVTAKDWAGYAGAVFTEQAAALEQQLTANRDT